jgi:group I intron endonuclease
MNWRDWEPRLRSERGVVYQILNITENRSYIGQTEGTFWERYDGGKWWKYSRNRYLKADYERLGSKAFVVILLETDLPPDELRELEALYIIGLGSIYPRGYNLKYYPSIGEERLVSQVARSTLETKARNRVLYPERTKPRVYTETEREAASLRMKGQNNPMFGRKHNPKTKDAIRIRKLGKKMSPKAYATYLANRKSGKDHFSSKPVCQIDPETNQIVATFESGNLAAKAVGTRRTEIYRCLKGSGKSKGYFWRYFNETT